MAEEAKPKTAAAPTKAASSESVADAPGPISPEHESGSWEQTAKVDEARDALRDAQGPTGTDKG